MITILKIKHMIDNPNTYNFSEEEMLNRQNYIPTIKNKLLAKLKDLTNKIETEEPFPHGNQTIDSLFEIWQEN